MAARGSFQKRQKEAARREKRQLKLDRRQGRQPAKPESNTLAEPSLDESSTEPGPLPLPSDSPVPHEA
ncbi:MAG: hypothetical protein WB992_25925 [Bryobacteraceae bacterium]